MNIKNINMNKKGFIKILVIIGVVILIGVTSYFIVNQQTSSPNPSPTPSPAPTPTPPDSPTPAPAPNPPLSNECEQLTGYSVKEYQGGWKEAFMKENKLSESQFNMYITVTDVSLRPIGNTCDLTARYTIKKDWLSVNRVDSMTLGVPPTISPSNLPLESDPAKPGRIGVSAINLHDSLSFESKDDALNYFVSAYDLVGTNARIQKEDFQYFWNKENAENSDYPFAGEGGEAYITVVGTIDSSQNKCYRGDLSLVTKETTYRDTPCIIN